MAAKSGELSPASKEDLLCLVALAVDLAHLTVAAFDTEQVTICRARTFDLIFEPLSLLIH